MDLDHSRKRKTNAWDEAETVVDHAGNVITRTCSRCQQIDLREKITFLRNHGPKKCKIVINQTPKHHPAAAAAAATDAAAAASVGRDVHEHIHDLVEDHWFDATEQWDRAEAELHYADVWNTTGGAAGVDQQLAEAADAAAAFEQSQQAYQQLLATGASAGHIQDQLGVGNSCSLCTSCACCVACMHVHLHTCLAS